MLEHELPLQKPKTPKSTPLYVPMGIALTIGVEMDAMTRNAKATNSKTESGVAGRTMVPGNRYFAE